jgi:hypothetical protein
MGDKTRGISVGGVPVIDTPAKSWIVAGVVEDNRPNPVGALEVGEKKGATLGNSLGHGLNLAHFEDFVGNGVARIGAVVDGGGHKPQTEEKQNKEHNSCQNRHNCPGKGGA